MFVAIVGVGIMSLSLGPVLLFYGLLGSGIPPQAPADPEDMPARKPAWLIRSSSLNSRYGVLAVLFRLPVVGVGAMLDHQRR